MELRGEVAIAAPRARVWAALNDPEVLARCIEGVESLTRATGPDGERFEGKMNARVGPVRATFTGQVTLADVVAPESYRLVGEGKGGVAGFAKGEAAVTLAETAPDATQLAYVVTSSVGGKLAQLGARLIEGTAKAYAETFFQRLKAEVETLEAPDAVAVAATPALSPTAPVEAAVAAPVEAAVAAPVADKTGLSPYVWGAIVIALVLIFLAWEWH